MPARSFPAPLALILVAVLAMGAAVDAQSMSRPTGIYCSCPPTSANSSSSMAAVLAQPFVDGILVRVGWDLLEPSPGVFDWSLIQSERNLVAAAGKKMTLAVVQGSNSTPSWLLGMGVQTVSYTFGGQTHTRPVPWDSIYLARWTSFISALGAQFDGDPAIALVHATHASHNSLEMQLGILAEADYLNVGYTDAVYAQSWTTVIDSFAAAFPSHPIDVDVHPVFQSDAVAQTVAAAGVATHGDRFGTFGGWWSVKNAKTTYPGMWSIFQDTAAASFTNAQNVGSFTTTPERYDNDVNVFADAFELGLDTGLRYFEVWNSDLVNPSLATLLADVHARVHCAGWHQLYEASGPVGTATLDPGGCPDAGEIITFDVAGGPPSTSGAIIFGTTRLSVPVLGGDVLVGPLDQLLVLGTTLDATGAASLPAALPAPLPSITLMAQVIAYDAALSTWWLSNGLEFRTP